MMMAAPGMTPRQSTITAPAPTNAFAPPPKVLEDYGDASTGKPARPSEVPTVVGVGGSSTSVDAGAPAKVAPVVPLPAADCGDGCKAKFRDCDGGTCDKTYRACMRGCFK
jgi:hypothetical protein